MFLKKETQESQYVRRSKTGLEHSYTRIKTIAVLRCDNCDSEFTRDLKKMDHKRLSNNYFHVCSNCDSKRFAQKVGVKMRRIYKTDASSDRPIGSS